MAYDLSREFIGDQCQIQKALLRAQISDVADPHLVGAGELELFDLIGKYRQIVTGVRRAGVGCGLELQQQVALGQDPKETVPTNFNSGGRQLGLQHLVKFPAAQARLESALRQDHLLNDARVDCLTLATLALGVVVLATHPQPPAHRADRHPKDFPLAIFNAYVGCAPRCFFLKPSTSLMPARSQAILVNARSSTKSMLASANARSSARTRRFNCSV